MISSLLIAGTIDDQMTGNDAFASFLKDIEGAKSAKSLDHSYVKEIMRDIEVLKLEWAFKHLKREMTAMKKKHEDDFQRLKREKDREIAQVKAELEEKFGNKLSKMEEDFEKLKKATDEGKTAIKQLKDQLQNEMVSTDQMKRYFKTLGHSLGKDLPVVELQNQGKVVYPVLKYKRVSI